MSRPSRRPVPALAAALAAIFLLAFAPAALAADTITGSSDSPVFTDTNNADDALTVTQNATTGDVTFHNANDTITTAVAGCSVAGSDVTCTGPVNFVTLTLADGNDSATLTGVTAAVSELGGNGNDTLRADSGTLDGGAGDDTLIDSAASNTPFASVDMLGGPGNDTLTGGPNEDVADYSDKTTPVTATLDGQANDGAAGETDSIGAGVDDIVGGTADDTLTGSDTDNSLVGGAGNDTLNGAGGNDTLEGDNGNDTLNGGAGDDSLEGDQGTDVYSGGDGNDTAVMTSTFNASLNRNDDLTASLDGQANDGQSGENDNIGSDVENILAATNGNTTLTGNADFNVITGGDGKNTIDGGAGSDVLSGGASDDTINAVDGFTDRVNCAGGTDTANVDQFDSVNGCEKVNVTQTASAVQDKPPTVTLTAPGAGAKLPANTPTTITANASDDRGVKQVVFAVNDRIVCTDTTAPYTCSYQPTGAEVNRDTLIASAVDTSNQAGFATRSVTVSPFTGKLSAKATPKRDARSPFHFTTSGRLTLPLAAGKSACSGTVTVTFKAGSRTVSTRRAKLHSNCSYKSAVTFRLPSRLHPGSLKVQARFGGNTIVDAARSKRTTVRVR